MDKDKILSFLKEYKENNMKKYHIVKMGIFGSVARGNATENSDIDIVVELEKQDFFYLLDIKEDIENEFHKSVDVVSYRERMNSFLKNRINHEAIYV